MKDQKKPYILELSLSYELQTKLARREKWKVDSLLDEIRLVLDLAIDRIERGRLKKLPR